MADHFPKGAVIREVNIEPAILFGAGRALLLQLAHPAVAQGVEDHSDFRANPFERLQGTLEATYAVVYGSCQLAEGVGRRIRWIHDHVVGPGYAANEPGNLLWVHATLVDTALLCYETLVEELAPGRAETYYQEMKRVAEVFGVPIADQPGTLADFRAYVDETVGTLEVSDVGRELARFIVDPTLPLGLHRPMRPLLALQRLFTVATTPPAIRDQLGFGWGAAAEARYQRARRIVCRTFRTMPKPLRTAGPTANGRLLLRQARRHLEQWEATGVRSGRRPARSRTGPGRPCASGSPRSPR